MRLATLLIDNQARAVVQHGDEFLDYRFADPSLPGSVRELLEAGPHVLAAAGRAAESPRAVRIPVGEAQFMPPVPDPHKIICVGLNYSDHAQETNAALPTVPVLFNKFATALNANGRAIELPSVSKEVDYEAELVIVIGKRGRHIQAEEAYEFVAGYMIGHDVSARDWQRRDGKQWMIGKTFDTFAPTGPTLVTRDEAPDIYNRAIRMRINGNVMQDSNTGRMIFRVEHLLPYISTVITLEPGDLIFTGTPSGVGMARKPPVWLKPGDVTEVEIEGLGVLRNTVVQGQ